MAAFVRHVCRASGHLTRGVARSVVPVLPHPSHKACIPVRVGGVRRASVLHLNHSAVGVLSGLRRTNHLIVLCLLGREEDLRWSDVLPRERDCRR